MWINFSFNLLILIFHTKCQPSLFRVLWFLFASPSKVLQTISALSLFCLHFHIFWGDKRRNAEVVMCFVFCSRVFNHDLCSIDIAKFTSKLSTHSSNSMVLIYQKQESLPNQRQRNRKDNISWPQCYNASVWYCSRCTSYPPMKPSASQLSQWVLPADLR